MLAVVALSYEEEAEITQEVRYHIDKLPAAQSTNLTINIPTILYVT